MKVAAPVCSPLDVPPMRRQDHIFFSKRALPDVKEGNLFSFPPLSPCFLIEPPYFFAPVLFHACPQITFSSRFTFRSGLILDVEKGMPFVIPLPSGPDECEPLREYPAVNLRLPPLVFGFARARSASERFCPKRTEECASCSPFFSGYTPLTSES